MFSKADDLDDRQEVGDLLTQLQVQGPVLEKLLARFSNHWGYEDPIYRFYHHSFKVYSLQDQTLEIVKALQGLAPGLSLNEEFARIVAEGTGKVFQPEDNRHWLEVTRPIMESFFHARFFLEMAVKYGKELKAPPRTMPSGWAALLYLYNLR